MYEEMKASCLDATDRLLGGLHTDRIVSINLQLEFHRHGAPQDARCKTQLIKQNATPYNFSYQTIRRKMLRS